MGRRRALLAHTWVQLGLWIAIVVVANHLSSAWFLRVDLTEDQRHTLSPTAREIMGRLDRPLVARAYFTGGLQAPYHTHEQVVRDKLEELRAWSGGQMEIHHTDPGGDRSLADEAVRFGLSPIPYVQRSWEGGQVKQVFMGVSFVCGDRQSSADALAVLDTIEYELLRAVLAVIEEPEDRQTVGLLQGNGEPDLARFPADNPMGRLRDRLASSFDLLPVVLGGDEGVPESVDALLVIGPQQAVPDRAQYQLDQFLMRGGRAAFFLASTRADFRSMRAVEVRHDLNALLGHYGVQIGRDTVIDREHNERMSVPIPMGGRRRLVSVNYPLIPVSTHFERRSTIVRRLDRAVLPFASTMGLAELLPVGVEGQVLLESSPSSTAASTLVHIGYDAFQAPPFGEVQGPFPLAVSMSGRLSSFFAERPIPPPAGRDQAQDDPLEKLLDGEPTRVVVVGSADFVANNLAFVQNTVDWLLEAESLIEIRSRQAATNRLAPPGQPAVLYWKAAVLLAPLLLLAGLGLFLGWRRSR